MPRHREGMAQRVRIARLLADLTQQELANKVGVRKEVITRIETGAAKRPSAELLVAIADVLKVSVTHLVTGKEHTEKQEEEPAAPALTGA